MRSSIRLIGFVAISLCMLAGSVVAETTEHYADQDGALGVARGAAATEIRAALTAKTRSCTGMDFQPRRCSLADNAVSADVHYGSAADRRFAFVSVRWQSDPTGNAVEAKGFVFVTVDGSPFRLLGETELIGESVSDVVFEAQRITYATAYLRPGDSRSQPTGRRRYEISLGATGIGPATIQRTGFGQTASAQSPQRGDDALELVKRLYEAGEDYAAIFGGSSAANAMLSPGLARIVHEAVALSPRCPIYDGDPRLGGAQGAGGPTRMRYASDIRQDSTDRRTIIVTAGQAEAPDAVSRTRVALIRTPAGWRIDDLVAEGMNSYKAALQAAITRCRRRG
jgi:hypothetical protein